MGAEVSAPSVGGGGGGIDRNEKLAKLASEAAHCLRDEQAKARLSGKPYTDRQAAAILYGCRSVGRFIERAVELRVRDAFRYGAEGPVDAPPPP